MIHMGSVDLLLIKYIGEKNKMLTSVLQWHVIINPFKTEGMSRDRNEDIWPNDKLPNVYHMSQAWRKGKWYSK